MCFGWPFSSLRPLLHITCCLFWSINISSLPWQCDVEYKQIDVDWIRARRSAPIVLVCNKQHNHTITNMKISLCLSSEITSRSTKCKNKWLLLFNYQLSAKGTAGSSNLPHLHISPSKTSKNLWVHSRWNNSSSEWLQFMYHSYSYLLILRSITNLCWIAIITKLNWQQTLGFWKFITHKPHGYMGLSTWTTLNNIYHIDKLGKVQCIMQKMRGNTNKWRIKLTHPLLAS